MESFPVQSQAHMRSTREHLLYSILPLLKHITLTLKACFSLTQNLRQFLKQLSSFSASLFLPVLALLDLHPPRANHNTHEFHLLMVHTVKVLLSTAVGVVLGFLLAKICKPPPEYTRFTIIMTAFCNTGNLPLAIVGSVCRSPDNRFGQSCDSTGTTYVSFAQWVAVLHVYTLVYHMMEPPMQYYEVVEDYDEIRVLPNDLSRALLMESEWPGMEDRDIDQCKTQLIAERFCQPIQNLCFGR